jgi:hypothetical protein
MRQSSGVPAPPPDESVVWRFMSLSKLLDVLVSGELNFVQLRHLKRMDPYENEWPRQNLTIARRIATDQNFRKEFSAKLSLTPLAMLLPTDSILTSYSEDRLRSMIEYNDRAQYVSCWHCAKYEPSGFWKLYSSEHEGVAIKTKLGTLLNSFYTDQWGLIIAGSIEYIDHEVAQLDPTNGIEAVYRKRKNFEFEQEVRLCCGVISGADGDIIERVRNNPDTIRFRVDLNSLMDAIIVSPQTDAWIKETILQLLDKLGLKIPVKDSELSTVPISKEFM